MRKRHLSTVEQHRVKRTPTPTDKPCAKCNGAGLLAGSTFVNPIACDICHGYGVTNISWAEIERRRENEYHGEW